MTSKHRAPAPVPGHVPGALADLGVDVERSEDTPRGVEHWARCPAHAARTGRADAHASWSINETSGAHHCFSCGYSGTFVSLAATALGIERAAASAWVAGRGGIEAAAAKWTSAAASTAVDTTTVINEASLALFTDPPASALAQRGLLADSAHHYDVRWDPSAKGWVLPIRTRDGVLLGWQAKSERIFRNRPYGVKKSATLFGAHVFDPQGGPALVVESPLDAVRLDSAGIYGALATFGSSVSPAQVALIVDLTDDVVVAMDNDAPGWRASADLIEALTRRGLRVRYFDYPAGPKDPGDMDDAALAAALARALPATVVRLR